MAKSSAQITTLTNIQIDEPEFQALLQRLRDVVELSFRKALAHEGDPANFPLSSQQESLEAIFSHRLQKVSAEKKAAAVQNALAEARSTRAGSLSAINLHIATPVQEQVQALPLPGRLTPDALSRINQLISKPASQGTAASNPFHQVELRLLKLKCVQKTKEPFEGRDEIVGGAVLVRQDGTVSQAGSVNFGQFSEGDVRSYTSPPSIATIPLGSNTTFPLAMAVTLSLVEMDSDNVADVLDGAFEAVKALKGQIVDAIGSLLGLSSDSSSSSTSSTGAETEIFVVLLNIAVGAIINLSQELLGKWFHSDMFKQQLVMVALPSATSLFPDDSTNSKDEVLTFNGDNFKGRYDLTYHWHIV